MGSIDTPPDLVADLLDMKRRIAELEAQAVGVGRQISAAIAEPLDIVSPALGPAYSVAFGGTGGPVGYSIDRVRIVRLHGIVSFNSASLPATMFILPPEASPPLGVNHPVAINPTQFGVVSVNADGTVQMLLTVAGAQNAWLDGVSFRAA